MQYLLQIFEDETFWNRTPPEEIGEMMAGYRQFGIDVGERMVGGNALQPTATATSVRVRDGERLVTDGPFAETKEQLGGYYLLECKDLDEAIEWAKKAPAPGGAIEVRPVMDYDSFGAEEPAAAEASS